MNPIIGAARLLVAAPHKAYTPPQGTREAQQGTARMPSSKEFSDTAALGQPQDEIDPTDPYGESADAAASTKTLQPQSEVALLSRF